MMNLITVAIILGMPLWCLGYLIYRVRQLIYLETWARTLYQSSTPIEVPQPFHDAFRDVEVIEP